MLKATLRAMLRDRVRRHRGRQLDRGVVRFGRASLKCGLLPLHLRYLLTKYEVDCVIDVGANRGQFAGMLRSRVDYRGPILSFEPGSAAFRALQGLAARERDIHPHRLGLGARADTLALNVMELDVLASFLAPVQSEIEITQNRVVGTEEVPVRRLDDLTGEIPLLARSRRMLLKIDTQGFDLQVLAGAEGLLDRVVAVLVETPFARIYDGAPSYVEVFDALRAKGFHPSAFAASGIHKDRIIDVDALFVNAAFAR